MTNFRPPWRRIDNCIRNMVSLAAIRVWGISPLASRWNGRNFSRILQKSREAIRRLMIPAPLTHYAANNGSIWTYFRRRSRRGGNGVRNMVFVAAIRVWEVSQLTSRWGGRNCSRIMRKSRALLRQLTIPPTGPKRG